ncbi:hypothetical protein Fluta_2904 [Fluviicola taffensis DSM 16823]|uniref:Uncharacterized protein n=1 Tax=Fluviicola taffensis (strain DSM 16823 / NCIMB 13979 / RW262) TaxID=755732 RepID=F2IIF7_FLUTR|nr:hypothetical protein Fluta_2904 [Fluviicola taffensis DSM 16823]
MWSIQYKPVSVISESTKTNCKVCKAENQKEILTEKKVLTILYIIPIRIGTNRIEICPSCNSRMKIKEDQNLIDSRI